MKKLVAILCFAAMMLVFNSCKKDCVCTVSQNDVNLDQETFTELTGSECEEKVDELTSSWSAQYALQAGFKVECVH